MSYQHPTGKARLYKQGGSAKWYMDYYDQFGKRRQVSTRTIDFDKAKEMLDEQMLVLKLVRENRFDLAPRSLITVEKAAQETIKRLEKRQAKGLKDNKRFLLKIVEKFGKTDIKKLKRTDLEEVYDNEMSETMVRNYNRAFKLLFNRCIDLGYIDVKPELPEPRIAEKHKRRALTPEQIKALHQRFLVKSETSKNATGKVNFILLSLFIKLLHLTGLRYGELQHIRFQDVKPQKIGGVDAYILQITKSKTVMRDVIISEDAYRTIQFVKIQKNIRALDTDHVFSREPGVFPDFTNILKEDRNRYKDRYKANNVDDITLYQLRHTFITEKIKEGKTLFLIAQHCGTSVQMIEDYYADAIANTDVNHIFSSDQFQSALHLKGLMSGTDQEEPDDDDYDDDEED
ncbi:integrase [Arsukibacterium ikkense]|uniref:Integrase n=1 Tax=Arsukibacterium ikkense TaxID=336831 RepID=A0A0M2V3K8_9GAMM|nr:site-specific integrase [Arsukibacterium ikkense]KKO45442.1 integrase [Arsukibacterium ikkense]